MTTPHAPRIGLWLSVFVVLAMGIVAATTVGAWKAATNHGVVSGAPHRPETTVAPADDPVARDTVLRAAKVNVAKVLSYAADTVEADVAAAAEVTTGQFRDYYETFTKDVVIPAAHEKDVSTSADVVDAGVVSLDEAEAEVLAFVNQSTTSRAEPEPKLTASAVRVRLLHQGDSWLIEAFDPQ